MELRFQWLIEKKKLKCLITKVDRGYRVWPPSNRFHFLFSSPLGEDAEGRRGGEGTRVRSESRIENRKYKSATQQKHHI